MKGLLIVCLYEIRYRLTRKSFLFATFGLPLVAAAIFWGAARLRGSQSAQPLTQIVKGPPTVQISGFVDQAGVIRELPPGTEKVLRPFANEADALAALQAGEIRLYYLLPPDFPETGEGVVVQAEDSAFAVLESDQPFERLVMYNLLRGDQERVSLLTRPMMLQEKPLETEGPERDRAHPLAFFIPYAVMLLFYMLIFTTATILLSSVNRERENRLLEILICNLEARTLIGGKILALGLLGLLQTAVWVGTGYALLRASGRVFRLPPAFQLPPSFLAWALVFFLLGYAIYGALMAGLGVLVPNSREATQHTIVLMIPLMIPLFLLSTIIEQPHGPLAVAFSLFPLTAPEVMMTRLAAGGVPFWQVALSAALMAMSAWGIVLLVARLFHSQQMLAGQPPRWPWRRARRATRSQP